MIFPNEILNQIYDFHLKNCIADLLNADYRKDDEEFSDIKYAPLISKEMQRKVRAFLYNYVSVDDKGISFRYCNIFLYRAPFRHYKEFHKWNKENGLKFDISSFIKKISATPQHASFYGLNILCPEGNLILEEIWMSSNRSLERGAQGYFNKREIMASAKLFVDRIVSIKILSLCGPFILKLQASTLNTIKLVKTVSNYPGEYLKNLGGLEYLFIDRRCPIKASDIPTNCPLEVLQVCFSPLLPPSSFDFCIGSLFKLTIDCNNNYDDILLVASKATSLNYFNIIVCSRFTEAFFSALIICLMSSENLQLSICQDIRKRDKSSCILKFGIESQEITMIAFDFHSSLCRIKPNDAFGAIVIRLVNRFVNWEQQDQLLAEAITFMQCHILWLLFFVNGRKVSHLHYDKTIE